MRLGFTDDERRGDQIARLLARQHLRIVDLVGHRHRRHEARDVAVLDEHFVRLWLDAENLSLELVLSGRRCAAARCGHQNRHEQTSHILNSIKFGGSNRTRPPIPMIWVGTSRYNYPEWKGSFYPQKMPSAKMLPYYAEHF